MQQNNNKIYFENLDSLRFFAFVSVFLFHFFNYIKFDCDSIPFLEPIKINLIDKGFLGVNFFFVLSGFLITYLLLHEKKTKGYISIKKFYARRVFRIWPLFFIVLVLGFWVFPYLSGFFDIVKIKEHILYYIFFMNNFDIIYNKFDGFGNGLLGGLWSIAIEEQYYLLWPFIIHSLSNRNFIALIILLIVASFLFRVNNIENSLVLYFHTFSVINDLLIGSLAACLLFFSNAVVLFMKTLPRLIILGIYVLGFIYIYFSNTIVEIYMYRFLDRIIISVFFVFIILEQVYSDKSFFKFGQVKFFNYLGKISYGLYMLHLISIMAMQKINVEFSIDVNTSIIIYLAEMIAAFSITVVISWISYTYFEKIFLNIKNRFYSNNLISKREI